MLEHELYHAQSTVLANVPDVKVGIRHYLIFVHTRDTYSYATAGQRLCNTFGAFSVLGGAFPNGNSEKIQENIASSTTADLACWEGCLHLK